MTQKQTVFEACKMVSRRLGSLRLASRAHLVANVGGGQETSIYTHGLMKDKPL